VMRQRRQRRRAWTTASKARLDVIGGEHAWTLHNPISSCLKYHAGVHPKFRGLITGLAQVTLAFVIYLRMNSSVRTRSPFPLRCLAYVGVLPAGSCCCPQDWTAIVHIQYDLGH
jgi:hypothetical protein